MKKLIKWLLLLAVLTVAGWYAYGYVRKMPEKKQQAVPVATVRQGDVVIRAYTRGELRALRSEALVAPNLNGTVQVTRLAPLGAFAREKNLIVEFDDSEVAARIEETQLGL
jgi:multidrug efflux pump subunit AcrA (membrane-fusion protein)